MTSFSQWRSLDPLQSTMMACPECGGFLDRRGVRPDGKYERALLRCGECGEWFEHFREETRPRWRLRQPSWEKGSLSEWYRKFLVGNSGRTGISETTDKQLDELFDTLDEALLAGRFEDIDCLLADLPQLAKSPGLTLELGLGILSLCFAAKKTLKNYLRAVQWMKEWAGPDEEQNFVGL